MAQPNVSASRQTQSLPFCSFVMATRYASNWLCAVCLFARYAFLGWCDLMAVQGMSSPYDALEIEPADMNIRMDI